MYEDFITEKDSMIIRALNNDLMLRKSKELSG